MSLVKMIYKAKARLEENIIKTPILSSPFLDAIAGKKILIKAECLQKTGSFKYRGAWAAISALEKNVRDNGVIAYSSGNHAQGIAAVAKVFNIPSVIVMPDDAPTLKIKNTMAYGAEVITYDRSTESREDIGLDLATKRGLTLIKPYDDFNVISGGGTLGLEIASQVKYLNLDRADVLVCCGGGGLASGVAVALKEASPRLRVRPCEPSGYDDTTRSLISGKRESINFEAESLCDAILTPKPGELTFPILSKLAGPGLVVDDDEVLMAMAICFQRLKLVAEPGGAVALASALYRSEQIEGDTVIVVITGGNVDPKIFSKSFSFLNA